MIRSPGKLLACLCISASGTLHAQSVITFNLRNAAANDTVTLLPGSYQFKVASLSPKYAYVIALSQGVEQIRPIPFATSMGLSACKKISEGITALKGATRETDVPSLIQQLRTAISAESADTSCKELASDAERLILRTERTLEGEYTLRSGDYVVVDVSRIEDGKATQRWQRRFTTGAPGGWRATYGYAFPALMRISHFHLRTRNEGRQFFARQVGDTGSIYVIDQQRRTRQFDAVPAVMFSYAPAVEGRMMWSWTAGFAADLTKPVVFFGPSLTYRSNLQISAGTAFREEKVQIGRYSLGDTVHTNLTTEQLQEDAFRIRPFVSITLRFDKNPFKNSTPESGTEQKPANKQPSKDAVGKK